VQTKLRLVGVDNITLALVGNDPWQHPRNHAGHLHEHGLRMSGVTSEHAQRVHQIFS